MVISAFAFVDDTDVIHAAADPHTDPLQVLAEAQQAVNTWEGILRATGGAIGANNDTKAFWYFLDFTFVGKKWEYKSLEQLQGQLLIRNYDGRNLPITRLEPKEARETLGIMIAMDGNQVAQFNCLRQKAKIYGEQLRTGYIDRHHAWYSYTGVFSKTLEYPMEAINLSLDQWDLIVKEFMGHLLNKMGIVHNMARDLVFSSKKYNGLGWKHPYYLQHIKHIALILGSHYLDPQSKALINTVWEEACYECGWNEDLMKAPKEILELITDGWLKETILFMKEHRIYITRGTGMFSANRSNDSLIISKFNKVCNNKAILYALNLCRLFLDVKWVSDLTSAQGSEVVKSKDNCILLERFISRPSLRKKPKYEQLDWKLWDFYLNLSGISFNNNNLNLNLGPWKSLNSSGNWKWCFSHSQDRIWAKHQNIWMLYDRVDKRKRTRSVSGRFIKVGFSEEIPPEDLVRADIFRNKNNIYLKSVTQPLIPRDDDCINEDNNLVTDKWSNECLITCSTREEKLVEALTNGTALAVSDGSFKKGRGTSAAIIEELGDPESRIIIMNRVPGARKDHSPFRAELAGVIGIVSFIVRLARRKNLDMEALELGWMAKQL